MRTIVIRFRATRTGRALLRVVQIAPVCRPVGLINVRAHRGVNKLRINGRLGRGWLRDGTYLLVTPTKLVRFAVVKGRPTRVKRWIAPSVCRAGAAQALARLPLGGAPRAAAWTGTSAGGSAASETPDIKVAGSAPAGSSVRKAVARPARVLGTAADRLADAVTALHPVFYGLLALAIAAFAAATLPASVVPTPWLSATLARQRALLTLAGSAALVAVIVAYLLTLS